MSPNPDRDYRGQIIREEGTRTALYKKLELDFETKIKRYNPKFEMISCPQNPKTRKVSKSKKRAKASG